MTANYSIYRNLHKLSEQIQPDSIISRRIFKNSNLDITLFAFDAGQELSEHTSSHSAIIEFISGDADLTLGQDHVQVKGGDWLYMHAGLAHSLVAKTRLVMLLTLIKSTDQREAN